MNLMADGTQRSFIVHVPPSYDGKKRVPVLFDFHGLSGNGMQQKSLSKWAQVADQNGFIAVFPNGLDNAWNAGLCCSTESDDVTFVRLMVDKLFEETCIDRKRVYASGCSNGGGMSFRLACEAADIIAGVAPVDFDCVVGSGCGQCEPDRPLSVVQFRGTNDSLVDYDGSGAFMGAEASFAKWGELNMCTDDPGTLPENTNCSVHSTCGAESETVLCTVQNGTHCGSYGSFNIAELAWNILQKHSLP